MGHFETHLDLHDVDDLCFESNPFYFGQASEYNFMGMNPNIPRGEEDYAKHPTSVDFPHSTSPRIVDYSTPNDTPQSSKSQSSESEFADFSEYPRTIGTLPKPALDIPYPQGAKSLLAAVQQQHQQHYEKFENLHFTSVGTVTHIEPHEAGPFSPSFVPVRSTELPQISIAFSPHQLARLSTSPHLIDQIELPPPNPRVSLAARQSSCELQ